MDGFLIVIGVVWLILSAVGKKKKREAAEAAKRARAETDAYTSPASPGEGDASPIMPDSFPPEHAPETPFDPFFGGLNAPAKPVAPAAKPQPAPVQRPAAKPAVPAQRSTTLATTLRHTLEASSLSGGHVHMESSLTGVESECPPTKPAVAASAPAAANTAFRWSADEARRGIVLAEILGKPVALRR